MNTNPSASENNTHHEGGYRSQEDFDNEMFGKGKGDPDFYPDPNNPEDKPEPAPICPKSCYICWAWLGGKYA